MTEKEKLNYANNKLQEMKKTLEAKNNLFQAETVDFYAKNLAKIIEKLLRLFK